MHPYKQPVNIYYYSTFAVSFYCFLLSKYLGLIAVHHFQFPDQVKVAILVKVTILTSHINTDQEKQ